MTQPDSGPGPRPGRRARLTRLRMLLVSALIVVVLMGAIGIWYVFFRSAGPPPIGPGAPVIPPGAVASAPASSPPPTAPPAP